MYLRQFLKFYLSFSLLVPMQGIALGAPHHQNDPYEALQLKAGVLMERSLLLATQQVVNDQLAVKIAEAVVKIYDETRLFDFRNPHSDPFKNHAVELLTRTLLIQNYEEILKRAHNLATSNLALWSDQAFQKAPGSFSDPTKLYEQVKPLLTKGFQRLADPRTGVEGSAIMGNVIRSAVTEYYEKINFYVNSSGKTGTRTNPPPTENKEKIAGTSTDLVLKLDDGYEAKGTYNRAQVEIPPVNIRDILAENPESLKYKFRKPLAGLTHLTSQYILFNIPLFFITVAMVGLDMAKNPLAIEQFLKSLEDPSVMVGFGFFSLTNHHVANAFIRMIKDKRLHVLASPIGMAAGMLAQSLFSDLWNDQNMRGCARSLYNPQKENQESCNLFWNSWVLSGKINQYAPAVMGLLSTAVSAGMVQSFGSLALIQAKKAVKAAEAELAQLQANDPFIQKTKEVVGKATQYSKQAAGKAAQKLKSQIKDVESFKRLMEQAKLNLANAQAQLQYLKSMAIQGFDWTKGQIRLKFAGAFVLPKALFSSKEQLQAYLLKIVSLKKLLQFSVYTIGANLVFLALDPFISEPIQHGYSQMSETDFNLQQWLEKSPIIGFSEQFWVAFLNGKIKPPQELDYQTGPQIFEAYHRSLDYFLNHDFQGFDPLQCLPSEAHDEGVEPSSEPMVNPSKLSWLPRTYVDFANETLRSIANFYDEKKKLTQLYFKVSSNYSRDLLKKPSRDAIVDCLVVSNFSYWLDKNAEVEKNWRELSLSAVKASSITWTQTLSHFLTNYQTTRDFYDHMIGLFNTYRFDHTIDPKSTLPSEGLTREALLAKVKELSQVPFVEERTDEDKLKYEDLYPTSVGAFDTPEYGDYLIASMACGPDPKEAVSFMQKVRSLTMIPWDFFAKKLPSVFSTYDLVEPMSPIIETYPGTRFKFISPRIIPENKALCEGQLSQEPKGDRAYHPKKILKIEAPIVEGSKTYKNLMEYIAMNAKDKIVNNTEPVSNFIDWYNGAATDIIYNDEKGIWSVLGSNYENLMKYKFYPRLTDASMREGCHRGEGLTCAFHKDVYIRPNGIILSAASEIQTYIRTLRKMLTKFKEQCSAQGNRNSYCHQPTLVYKNLNDLLDGGRLDQTAQQLIYALMKSRMTPKEFNYADAKEKLTLLKELTLAALPSQPSGKLKQLMENQTMKNQTIPSSQDQVTHRLSQELGVDLSRDLSPEEKDLRILLASNSVLQISQLIFEKMDHIIADLEGYQEYSKLEFKKKNDSTPTNVNPYDPRRHGSQKQ